MIIDDIMTIWHHYNLTSSLLRSTAQVDEISFIKFASVPPRMPFLTAITVFSQSWTSVLSECSLGCEPIEAKVYRPWNPVKQLSDSVIKWPAQWAWYELRLPFWYHLQGKEQTTRFGINSMRNRVSYRAARRLQTVMGVLSGPVVPPAAFCTSLNALCIFCQVCIFLLQRWFFLGKSLENLWKPFIW